MHQYADDKKHCEIANKPHYILQLFAVKAVTSCVNSSPIPNRSLYTSLIVFFFVFIHVAALPVFIDKNLIPDRLDNAPTMNQLYGTHIPPLLSSRAFAIQTKATVDHPDRYKILQTSFRKVFDDPAFKEAITRSKGVWEYINYGGPEECAKYAAEIAKVGERFKPLLTGKKA